jgi:hypothetical protein
MTHNKKHFPREFQRAVNLALDSKLDDHARRQINKRLSESPERVVWDQMQNVDRLLESEPALQAPPDFALKVMGAIAAGKMPEPVRAMQQRTDLRAVIGILVAVALLLPAVLLTLLFTHQLLTDPVLLNALIGQVSLVVNTGIRAITSMFQGFVKGDTLMVLSFFVSLTLTIVTWTWMSRYFTSKRQQVVYRIPVQAA